MSQRLIILPPLTGLSLCLDTFGSELILFFILTLFFFVLSENIAACSLPLNKNVHILVKQGYLFLFKPYYTRKYAPSLLLTHSHTLEGGLESLRLS